MHVTHAHIHTYTYIHITHTHTYSTHTHTHTLNTHSTHIIHTHTKKTHTHINTHTKKKTCKHTHTQHYSFSSMHRTMSEAQFESSSRLT